MHGDPIIIEHMNTVLTNELTAINQYFLHARMLKNWGFERLAAKVHDESVGEMKHADLLIERLLMVEGLPNMQRLHKIRIGETVPEMLTCDLSVETLNQGCLKLAIEACEGKSDYVTREIFVKILDDTEEHIDWLETQIELIDKIGEQNYLQSQVVI